MRVPTHATLVCAGCAAFRSEGWGGGGGSSSYSTDHGTVHLSERAVPGPVLSEELAALDSLDLSHVAVRDDA